MLGHSVVWTISESYRFSFRSTLRSQSLEPASKLSLLVVCWLSFARYVCTKEMLFASFFLSGNLSQCLIMSSAVYHMTGDLATG